MDGTAAFPWTDLSVEPAVVFVIHEWWAIPLGDTPHRERHEEVSHSPTTRRLPLVELLIDTEAELFDLAVRSGL